MVQVETIRQSLIAYIQEVEDVSSLEKMDLAIKKIGKPNDAISNLSKPMRKRLDVDELKCEQNFKPIDKQKFFKKIDQLQIDESIDQLLEMAKS